jgi:hypothetical protein
MTIEEVLLAVLAGVFALVGSLMALLYRDVVRRLGSLDRKSSAALTILTVLLGHIPDVPPTLLSTIKTAIAESAGGAD